MMPQPGVTPPQGVHRARALWKHRAAALALSAGVIGSALAGAGVSAASAQPHAPGVVRATSPEQCTVQTAQLSWGVKERFRAYISGSIANGEWIVSDTMRYQTPNFIWEQSTGTVTSDLASGSVAFTGAVHFTGHEGAMVLDIADPVIEFDGRDTAYLLLKSASNDRGETVQLGTADEVRFAKIQLSGALEGQGETLQITAAETRLTAEGAAALNGGYGGYVAGEKLDPMTASVTLSGCVLGTVAPGSAATSDSSGDAAKDEPVTISAVTPAAEQQTETAAIPVPVLVAGGAAIAVIAVAGVLLLRGRNTGVSGVTDAVADGVPDAALDTGAERDRE